MIRECVLLTGGVAILTAVMAVIYAVTPLGSGPAPISDSSLTGWLVAWRCLVLAVLCLIHHRVSEAVELLSEASRAREVTPPPLR